ncbi:MAG TPA: mycothiol system anti-sigma-R factor [Candidatus Dormibacteraeota bacterium]
MNCQECVDRLERFVDRELSTSEVEEIKQHLDDCPPCAERYQFETSLKRLVKVCCEQETAPPVLREKLRQILF